MAQRKAAPTRKARQGQERHHYKIFPTPVAAALFFAEHRDYPLTHISYSLDERSGYFPEVTANFSSENEIWELLDRTSGERHAAEQARKASSSGKGGITGHEAFVPSWSTPEFMEWIETRQLGRKAIAQQKQFIDQGWHLDPTGTWYHADNEDATERRPNWETAANNTWEVGLHSNSATAENAEGILEDIDSAALRYLRLDMLSRGNTSVHAEGSISPTRALYLIKIVLMQHGTRTARDLAERVYPQTEIERIIARRQTIFLAVRKAESDLRASGGAVEAHKTKAEYLRIQHKNCNSILEQLKLTAIVPYKLNQIDALMQDLAVDIEEAHERIEEAQNRRGRLLTNDEREALCSEERPGKRNFNIRQMANKVLQIAEMVFACDAGDLHSTKMGQSVILEELENAMAILKLYSILIIYGGNDETSDLCSLVDMSEHDHYLRRLAHSTSQYRAGLYSGRLLSHSLTGIPIELFKRTAKAFKWGVRSSVEGAQLIARSAVREGVLTTLSCSAGSVFSRCGGALFGILRDITNHVLTPEFEAIEASIVDWRVPPTIPQLKQVAEAITQTDVPPAVRKELVKIKKDLFTILAEAGHAGLDELIHDPALRAFEVMPAGHNHFMYYVFATDQWVEMDDSQESLDELEARITRDAIYDSLTPDPWVEGTDEDGSTYWYNDITGTYAHEHPFEEREIIELEREIEDAAEVYTREQIQAAAGGAEREPVIPGAAELQAVGSPTGIMDQQEFAGKVDKLKKLKKELRDAAAFLHYGINENHPHGSQFAQALNDEANYDIANRWNRTHRRHRQEVNVAHRAHTGFGPRSNFNRAVLERREAEGAHYTGRIHAAHWEQIQNEMANDQDEALVEYNQQQAALPRGHGLSRKARGREKVREQTAAAQARAHAAQWANEQPAGEEALIDYNQQQAALPRGPRKTRGKKPAAHAAQWAQMNRELANEQWANELTRNVRNQQWEQALRERNVNPEWVGSQAGSQGGRKSKGGRTAAQERAYQANQAYHGKQWARQLYPERFAQGANANNAEYALAQRNESQAASQGGRRPAAQAQANEQEQQGAQWANEITGRYARHERQAIAAARPLKERWNGALGANRLPNSSNNESV